MVTAQISGRDETNPRITEVTASKAMALTMPLATDDLQSEDDTGVQDVQLHYFTTTLLLFNLTQIAYYT